ncbi:MAG: lysozyme [Chloracidobacterium sp.]|nr:lysozyme [Chloracidobacterium sp.]
MDRFVAVAIISLLLTIALVFILVYLKILALTPSMTDYPVRGIDVSHHNGEIDWERVAVQNIKFAYIKASEGNDLQDPLFERNWQEVRRVGLIPGAFHVFGNCSTGVEQARNFLLVWRDRGIALPPAVDVSSGLPCAGATGNPRNELLVFLNEIERTTGRRPIVYDNRTYIPGFSNNSGHQDIKWARGIIWHPHVFYGDEWVFWQYSRRGEIDGISFPVDLNVFQGSDERFKTILQGAGQ